MKGLNLRLDQSKITFTEEEIQRDLSYPQGASRSRTARHGRRFARATAGRRSR
jgi:hypothetical protein